MNKEEENRKKAITLYEEGIKPINICGQLNKSRTWFYKWLNRYQNKDNDWYKEESRSPGSLPSKIDFEIEQNVIKVRKNLVESRIAQIGANNIGWEFKKQGLDPPPIWAINRIIKRNNLVKARNEKYIPKGKKYPQFIDKEPYQCYQFDVCGPRYLKGGIRFYTANLIDVGSHLVRINIIPDCQDITLANALMDSWVEIGLPQYLQMDNALPFRGSNRYPHSFGIIIRMCLYLKIQPIFIPIAEPWRNGIIEHFQDTFDKNFFRVQQFENTDELSYKATEFQGFHNSYYRYSANSGIPPNEVLSKSNCNKRTLSEVFELPNKLYIHEGFVHLIRFIRSDCMLNVFGEKFPVHGEVQYEYVRATIDISKQQIVVSLDDKIICSHKYSIPKTAIKINQKV